MTPTQKLARVRDLCEELQHEDNEQIIQSRIEALAKALHASPYQCALVYWAMKEEGKFVSLFGPDVKVRFRAK